MAAVRSTGLTEWSRFDVPGMWSLLRNVSTVEAFRQAGAWQSTYEAAQSLARRLEWYRDGLAGKWSPDRSEAAAMYLGRLDELIGSAQQLADVSVANRQALVTLANAVDEARPKLQRVYEESEAMRQLGAQAKAGASVVRRQQQLHTQATEIMESLGSAAMDSWRHYATADDYQPPQSARGVDAPVSGGNLSNTGPSIGDSTGEAARSAVVTEPSLNYPSRSEPSSAWQGMALESPSEAVSLTGSPPSQAMNQADQVSRIPTATPIAADVNAPEVFDLDPVSTITVGRSGVQSLNESVNEVLDPSRTMSRALRRPGVIGGQSAETPTDITVGQGRAVNRVGGVIGGDGMGMGAPGFGAGAAKLQERSGRSRTYDVDDPWSVPEGGLSVIRPSPEPTDFDPGPGVIGIDR